jgi:hypothetical protein
VLTIVRAFWQICIFRLAPQDVPRSSVLLLTTALINLSLSTSINSLQLPFRYALLIALLEMGVMVGLTATLLYAFRHTGRLPQTLTALMGSGAVIGAIVLVLFVAFAQLPALPRLGVFLWNLLVMGHILRHALNIHLVAGFFIAVGYAVVLRQLILLADRLLSAAI